MGIIRKIGRRVKHGLRAVRDEAGHPGRPPPHKASENPCWEKPEDKLPPREEAAAADAADEKGRDQSKEFWFLDGTDADGWESTNADGSE